MAIIADAKAATSSEYYEVGIKVTYTNKDTSHTTCTASIQPLLRRVQSSARRYQHNWNVHFAVDYKHIKSYNYSGTGHTALPNDTAQTGVVSNGYLDMTVNEWYPWGDAWQTTLKNDGSTHYLGIRLECVGTNPKACPANDYLYTTVTTPVYQITPGVPSNPKASFKEDTRVITYSWGASTNAAYYRIWRKAYRADGTLCQKDGIGMMGWVGGTQTTSLSMTETLPDDCVKVVWDVWATSSTSTSASPGDQTVTIPEAYTKVWVKVDGTWKKAIPWVKVGDTWKKVWRTYVKDNGTWKRTNT